MKQHPEIKISVSGGGSGNGIKALIDGTCDIADSSRFIKQKEVKMAIAKEIYPVPHRIALVSIGTHCNVTHAASLMANLNLARLVVTESGRMVGIVTLMDILRASKIHE